MLASTSSRAVSRVATSSLNAAKPLASRAFSSTSPTFAKKKKDPNSMDVLEATRVLRALEIEKPGSAYSLTIYLARPKGKGSRAPTVRGRVVLPFDPRKSTDVLLVFAEANSISARLAREAGVAYVGAEDLFEPLLNGEIEPTKVLSTPGMLGSVTARLARFLGPKGLMPTVRRGGVGEGEELVEKIKEAKGATDWMSDARGVIRASVGRGHFSIPSVEANCRAMVDAVRTSMLANTSGGIDENLISRRSSKNKQVAGINRAVLQSSNGPRITLREL
ncbi:ribosomal protein L1-like protein [Papiliotrema laurentii]|uniref:Ribosomal protein L1-like protein n=1 Tax=Papiliotrema laurentii TaxID=5418 RepID=A0AAD9CW86_PAPLA|nr:ribosomal protein L1-like protein [Papiliotrema laurentii]